MRKRLLLCTAVAICFTHIGAVTIKGLNYTLNTSSKTATLTNSVDSVFGKLVIPATIEDEGVSYTVNAIGTEAFKGQVNMTSVTFPVTIEKVAGYAFSSCTGLTAFNISDLKSFLNIDFENRASNPLFNAKNIYVNGKLLTDLVIPDGIKKVKDNMFCNASCLTSLYTNDVDTIAKSPFSNCINIKTVTFGENLVYSGGSAFAGDNAIETVNISNLSKWMEVEFIDPTSNPLKAGIGNLYLNGNLVTDVIVPDDVMELKNRVFDGATCLKTATLHEGITRIGEAAFATCKNLKSVNIPNSVTEIGMSAFESCTGLAGDINFGNGLKSVGYAAFWYCSGLTSLSFGDALTKIDDYAFNYCSGIKEVKFGNALNSVGECAFQMCSSLTKINFPETLTTIKNNAFMGCMSLKQVDITNVGKWAQVDFSNIMSNPMIFGTLYVNGEVLKSLELPEGTNQVKQFAFSGGKEITEVVFPSSTTKISASAFNNCSKITVVNVKSSTPPLLTSSAFGSAVYNNAILNVPIKTKDAYSTATSWKKFKNINESDFSGIDKIDAIQTNVAVKYIDLNGRIVANPSLFHHSKLSRDKRTMIVF